MSPHHPPRWLGLSVRLYEALLLLYPQDFRREYGELMRQLFRDIAHERYQHRGVTGIALWWCSVLYDLALSVITERRKGRFSMTRNSFAQLSGPLLIIGGTLQVISAISQLQPGDHFAYYGVFQLMILLFAPGSLLVGLGAIGLTMQTPLIFSTPAKATLMIAGAGSIAMAAAVVVTAVDSALWNLWHVAVIAYLAALLAFGLLHTWRPILPVFRALPLMMAGGWLVMWFGIFPLMPQDTRNVLGFFIYAGMGLAWLGIGLAVTRLIRPSTLTIA